MVNTVPGEDKKQVTLLEDTDDDAEFSNDEFEDGATGKSSHKFKPKGSEPFKARVISVITPDEFYAIHEKDAVKFAELEVVIQKYFETVRTHTPMLKQNHRALDYNSNCFVFSSTFKKWCRAQYLYPRLAPKSSQLLTPIQGALNLRADVRLLDYGYTERAMLLNVRDVGPLIELFDEKKWPLLRIQCSLYGVKSKTTGHSSWHENEIAEFKKLILNEEFVTSVLFRPSEYQYCVNLTFVTPGVSLNVTVAETLTYRDVAVLALPPEQRSQIMKPAQKYKAPVMPQRNEVVSVVCLHVESPDCFYMYTMANQNKIDSLQEELNKAYEVNCKISSFRLLCPRLAQACVAKYSEDETFYRSVIVEIPKDRRDVVKVRYVDFGNEEYVKVSAIFLIEDRFLLSEVLSIPCRLWGLKPANNNSCYSDEITKELEDLILTDSDEPKALQMEVIDVDASADVSGQVSLKAQVTLKLWFEKEAGEREFLSISESLVKKKLAARSTDSASVGRSSHGLRVDSFRVLKELTARHRAAKAGASERLIEVTVTRVFSPGQFWVRILESGLDDYFREMSMRLGMHMEYLDERLRLAPVIDVNFALNESVAIFDDTNKSADRIWRRGEVTEIRDSESGDKQYLVLSVDTGHLQLLAPDRIRKLPEEYARAYPYSLECSVSELKPIGCSDAEWTMTAKEYLTELVTDKRSKLYILLKDPEKLADQTRNNIFQVDLVIMDEDDNGPFDQTTYTYVTVSEKLIQKGLAIPDSPVARERLDLLNKELNLNKSNGGDEDDVDEALQNREFGKALYHAKITNDSSIDGAVKSLSLQQM
ncbi:RING finger protein 17 [Halotydeus destructor]|nr:RING finger protein 17 [Halotydeus destructor]